MKRVIGSSISGAGNEVKYNNNNENNKSNDKKDDKSKEKTTNSKEKKRIFTAKQKQQCWDKATIMPGRDPERWRLDAIGNAVLHKLVGCLGCFCHEYDHIMPYSKGGLTEVDNCQILQSRVNILKSNAVDVSPQDLLEWSCAGAFTEKDLDMIELAIYGSIKRPNFQCYSKNFKEMSKRMNSRIKTDPSNEYAKFGCF